MVVFGAFVSIVQAKLAGANVVVMFSKIALPEGRLVKFARKM